MEAHIDIVQLEAIINRLLRQQSASDIQLSPALTVLVEIYARMIYYRMRTIDVALLPPECGVQAAPHAARDAE